MSGQRLSKGQRNAIKSVRKAGRQFDSEADRREFEKNLTDVKGYREPVGNAAKRR